MNYLPYIAGGAALVYATRNHRRVGRRVPLEPLQVEAEPDRLIYEDGTTAQRILGRFPTGMRKTKKIRPKRYAPTDAMGRDTRDIRVVTAGTRTIVLDDSLRDFRRSVWDSVQRTIHQEETAKAPSLWKSVVAASARGENLPTLRRLYGAWLITQRFKLAGIRPGMSIEDLYTTVTSGVPNTKARIGFPEIGVGFSKVSKKDLTALIKKNRRRRNGPDFPAINNQPYAMGLLSVSSKVIKGVKAGYWTGVMYLAPSTEAGRNVCRKSTEACAAACLGHSTGQLTGEVQRIRRIRRTLHLEIFPVSFVGQLLQEIGMFRVHALSEGLKPALRLNGSSDIRWETRERGAIPSRFPDTQFYDYSKYPYSMRRGAFQRKLPDGRWQYHLTYSWSDRATAWEESQEYLDAGGNVAVVVGAADHFKADGYHYTPPEGGYDTKDNFVVRPYDPAAPNPQAKHQNAARAFIRYCNSRGLPVGGYRAISGDENDARFLDPQKTWVVLYSKGGEAARDLSGFVVRVTPAGCAPQHAAHCAVGPICSPVFPFNKVVGRPLS